MIRREEAMRNGEAVVKIKPFVYEDWVTGQRIAAEGSPYFSTIHIDDRVYYFVKRQGSSMAHRAQWDSQMPSYSLCLSPTGEQSLLSPLDRLWLL